MRPLNIGDLKINVPIIQGGMGIGISLSKLASAVANMGGVGIISTVGIGLTGKQTAKGYKNGNIEAIRNEIRKAREMTPGVLGVNIMAVLTDFSEMVKTSIDEGIDIIFSGAGLPLDLPSYLTKGRPSWFPLSLPDVQPISLPRNGNKTTIICPMPLWWRDLRQAVTWVLNPTLYLK